MSDASEVRHGSGPLVLLIPVFNDWEALGLCIRQLGEVLAAAGVSAEVLVVDDGSTVPAPPGLLDGVSGALARVQVLELLRNLGHQRAIAVGLAFVHEHLPCRAVVVMDGDGEDAPEDVPRLLAEFDRAGGTSVVFAGRTRRSESPVFVVFYRLYRVMHRLLTGYGVEVGNFSVVPPRALRRLVVVSELWNHYAAAVFKARLPRVIVPTHRGRRLSGRGKMNFPALVTHGLSAISVFGEVVGVRLLIVTLGLAVLAAVGLVVVLYLKLFTHQAIPGWATTAAGVLFLVLMQAIIASGIFIFTVLNARQGSSFLPVRDFVFFCGGTRTLHPR